MMIASAFISRKVHEPGGMGFELCKAKGMAPLVLPRDVAGYRSDGRGHYENVTWGEIHANRTKEQNRRLEWKRQYDDSQRIRPAQVWTFFIPGFIFRGWWCYIRQWDGDDICGDGHKGDVSRHSKLALHLMTIIPLGVLPLAENFEQWMILLANVYPKTKTKKDRRHAGILTGWSDGRWFELSKTKLIERQHE